MQILFLQQFLSFFPSWAILSAASKNVCQQFVWMVRNQWRFLGNAALNAKVSQPASQISVSVFAQSVSKPATCKLHVFLADSGASCLYQGTVYHSNEQWQVDECTSCTCVSGDVHCRSERCPPLTCATVRIRNTHTLSLSEFHQCFIMFR